MADMGAKLHQLSDTARDWREGRRLRAWELGQAGWTQQQIAAALGVTQGAVSQWLTSAAQVGGPMALLRRPVPGAPPKLAAPHLAQLPDLLQQGATASGFRGEFWTCQRVAAVIERRWGVRYHERQV